VIATLRELGELHTTGVLTDREFETKKAELLAQI
jgi:Short C-terminal domain